MLMLEEQVSHKAILFVVSLAARDRVKTNFYEVSKCDSLYILLGQRGKVCKQLPIGWQNTKRQTALYTSSNKLIRQKNIYWIIAIILFHYGEQSKF